jgi:hypothetical protein
MNLDLTDEEATALIRHLREALYYARYPFAPRLDPLKAILARLEPPRRQRGRYCRCGQGSRRPTAKRDGDGC